MSDIDDFDDFVVDDSFLQAVDNISANANTGGTNHNAAGSSRSTLKPSSASTLVNAPGRGGNGGTSASTSSSKHNGSVGRLNFASTSNPKRLVQQKSAPELKLSQRKAIAPSSDDFDDFTIAPEDLLALDANPRQPLRTQSLLPWSKGPIPSSGSRIPPGKAGLGRTSSSGDGFQLHLNFRKESQVTKGKRWDRTKFAESGRRIVKGKGKFQPRSWGQEGDDQEEDEDEDFEPLVPGPKPLVDMTAEYPPQRHLLNDATKGEYIYPTNKSKREYQYEIIRSCFTDNCLVALPTGLGKTFVAGVVMLNFYRWFPTGKIVFLAPTKPLVNQQIEACQLTCGIPSADAAVMTGQSVSAKERAKLWAERRVFYCTPQTLDNDLKNGSVDPLDIVLAVFDEAHKASGNYAYSTILAYITAHHPYFRVLALTATPGSTVERVQDVVEALHISRIEIREAEAPEIRKYMNEKHTEKHIVSMTDEIEGFRDRWEAIMRPYVAKLIPKDILNERDLDCKRLKPFRLTAKKMEIMRDRNSGLKWAVGSLTSLEKMARAMGHLLEFSIGMFHTVLTELAGNTTQQGKKATSKGNATSLRNNTEFQRLLRDVEAEMNCMRIGKGGKTKADKHPKMQKTLELLLAHFAQAADDAKTHDTVNDTRAMVFCSFRECVLEVVDMLNEHPGLISATKFVGQSQGKQEIDKGFNQKEQKRTIAEFKEGKYNVLVSTSIGEEGLDIGEVDFVVIYDMPKQSIKLLQRIGRTGRKRDGKVHVLMSENREDSNWDTAQQTHRDIQEEILHSRNLELFADVERLLPQGEFPTCLEQEMEVDPWDPAEKKAKKLPGVDRISKSKDDDGVGKGKGKGKAKAKGRGHEIPEGGHEGFKTVAELLRRAGLPKDKMLKGSAGKRKSGVAPMLTDEEEEEGDTEEEREAELLFGHIPGNPTNRTVPKKVASTITKPKPKPKPKEMKNSAVTIVSDSDDELDLGDQGDDGVEVIDVTRPAKKAKTKPAKPTISFKATPPPKQARVTPEDASGKELIGSGLDFFNFEGPLRRHIPTRLPSSPPASSSPAKVVDLDPGLHTDAQPKHETKARLSPRTAARAGFSQLDPIDFSWDDMEDDMPAATSKSKPGTSTKPISPMPMPVPNPASRARIIGLKKNPTTPGPSGKSGVGMPPPPVPDTTPSPLLPLTSRARSSHDQTQPVRPIGRRPRTIVPSSDDREEAVPVNRRVMTLDVEGDTRAVGVDESESPFLPPKRLRRRHADSSPVAEQRRRKKAKGPAGIYFDLDAERSGSGSPDEPDTDAESDSDRKFAGMNFAPTQAPKGYNQHAAYVAGLSTQLGNRAGLKFRQDEDGQLGFLAKARKPVYITDEDEPGPRGGGGEGSQSEYELGSFICDDENVDYATPTHSDPLDSSFA